jgi:hypothetical protein
MTARGKALLGSALMLATLAAWYAGQVALDRQSLRQSYRNQMQWYRQAVAAHRHPQIALLRPHPFHRSFAQYPANGGLVAAATCVVLIALLVLGGRRWWTFAVALLPASVFLGLGDGSSLSESWQQPPSHWGPPYPTSHWVQLGGAVDAAMLLLVAGIAAWTLPRRTGGSAMPAVLRSVPLAVVAFGYWLIGHAIPDDADRILVGRLLLLILAAAVITTLQLSPALRLALLVVLPFADPDLALGAIQGWDNWSIYWHGLEVATATATYAGGAAFVHKRLAWRRPSPAPTSA